MAAAYGRLGWGTFQCLRAGLQSLGIADMHYVRERLELLGLCLLHFTNASTGSKVREAGTKSLNSL